MNEKNITLSQLSIVLERISKYVADNYAPAAHTHSSNEVITMSGYAILGEDNEEMHVALSSTDSLNRAIGKLERSIANIVHKIETDIVNHTHDDIYYRKSYIDNKENELLEADAQVLATANSFTTQSINTAVTNLVNGAPEALNTLGELAKALGEDENFSASISAELGKKVNGPTYSTIDNVAIFDGSDGKSIKDSGFSIATSVPPNALFTDYKVTSAPNVNKTIYLVGTSNAGGETGTLNFDSGIYISAAGSLTASVFNGDLSGNASSADVANVALETIGTLTIKVQNNDVDTFDGGVSKTVNITRELLDVHDTSYTMKATDAEVESLLQSIFG